MKKAFLLLMGAAILVSCNNNGTASSTEEKKDSAHSEIDHDKEAKEVRNRKVVTESINAFIAHNPQGVFKDADPNVTEYGDGNMPPIKGVDSARAMVGNWLGAISDIKGDDMKIVADGDWVMVWAKWSGTWKNDFMGQKASGKTYHVDDVDIFKLSDDGKIVEHRSILPGSVYASQIGMKMQ